MRSTLVGCCEPLEIESSSEKREVWCCPSHASRGDAISIFQNLPSGQPAVLVQPAGIIYDIHQQDKADKTICMWSAREINSRVLHVI